MNATIEELLSDLLLVGKTKSLGYLPLSTLITMCNSSVKEMERYAKLNNLGVLVFEDEECTISSGALYVYDSEKLNGQLKLYETIFNDANVPIVSPESYIKYISTETVSFHEYPKAYVAVGKTFNDDRFHDVDPFKATINTNVWR